jgi:hypothetical protein
MSEDFDIKVLDMLDFQGMVFISMKDSAIQSGTRVYKFKCNHGYIHYMYGSYILGLNDSPFRCRYHALP